MRRVISLSLIGFISLFLAQTSSALAFTIQTLSNLEDMPFVAPVLSQLPAALKSADTKTFCSGFAEIEAGLQASVTEKKAAVDDYLGGIVENLGDRRGIRDAKLEGVRSTTDQVRSEWYAVLENQAEMDEQRDAVGKYRERVEAAIDKRREGVNQAIEAFRTNVNELSVKRQSAMRSARDKFSVSVVAAFAKVETDCANGASIQVILQHFKANLKATRDKLASDKVNAQGMEDEVEKLATARKKEIAAVFADFRSELALANVDVRSVFAAK